MTSEQIKTEIRRYEGLISNLQKTIRQLQWDSEELGYLETKFRALKDDFENRQMERRRILTGIGQLSRMQIAMKYYEGMYDLLNGREYSDLVDALEDDVMRIRKKQNEVENRWNDYALQQLRYHSKLESLRIQLSLALRTEAMTS